MEYLTDSHITLKFWDSSQTCDIDHISLLVGANQ